MHYYFPININNRRLHYLNLQAKKVAPVFSFLVQKTDSPVILSVDAIRAQLIAGEGGKGKNVDFFSNKHVFVVNKLDEGEWLDGTPTYRIKIMGKDVAKKAKQETTGECELVASGFLGAEEPNSKAKISIDTTLETTPDDFIIVIQYENANKVFQDAIKFHLYEQEDLKSYALDFGSEASQIRGLSLSRNIDIIDTFLSFKEGTSLSRENYWQGDTKDNIYYKSVFFVNKKPGTIKDYGEIPNLGTDSFIPPLVKKTLKPEDYAKFVLLPNLKLLEISGQDIDLGDCDIEFTKETTIDDKKSKSLSDSDTRDMVLRLIISNFLHCILKQVNNLDADVCLRMVLMVPNVYYQAKIYDLIKGLYLDYTKIQEGAAPVYEHCKGFEVQVVSESDASFFGIRTNAYERYGVKNASKEHFLIIDAGKGTTDFSILQQTTTFNKFNSVYRDGIPAAGNVLTYAFFEALHAYMKSHGFNINESFLRKAQKSELLIFMERLETLKQNYQKEAKPFNAPKKENINSMQDLNRYLEVELNAHRQIPGCEKYVDKKVELLTNGIQTSLGKFMSDKHICFFQTVLSGRGFLFEPFRDAVIAMLVKEKWVKSDKDVIPLDGDDAKTSCLPGALNVETACTVNKNSGLIGLPILSETKDERRSIGKKIQGIFRRKGIRGAINDDYFYTGSPEIVAQNATIDIGGRRYNYNLDNRRGFQLLFVGNGFVIQTGSKTEKLKEQNFSYSDDTIAKLVKESLFPNFPGSIPDDSNMPDLKDKNEPTNAGQGSKDGQNQEPSTKSNNDIDK